MKFQNANLSSEERANDLLSRLSLEEKIAQMQCYNPKDKNGPNLKDDYPNGVGSVAYLAAAWDESKSVVASKLRSDQELIISKNRFGIPALFHIETLTGALMPEATSFPTGIGRGAAWDIDLEKAAGRIIGKEIHSIGIKHALAPVLDVSRDGRFGRYGECYSEDPTLVSALGSSYTLGIQNSGINDSYQVMATSKHFVGYQTGQGGIHAAATNIPERELKEIFAKPFQAAITKSNLRSVMNHYGAVDGEPIAASKKLLQELLRKEMGFEGLLVSDYASLEELQTRLKVCQTKNEVAKTSLEVGFDIEMPSPFAFDTNLIDIGKYDKKVSSQIDEAVKRILIEKFELGLFENPYPKDIERINQIFDDPEHKQVSLKYAQESIVLLKNDGTLPLSSAEKKITVIGHNGKSTRSLFGGYSYMSVVELAMGGRNTMAGIESNPTKSWKFQEKEKYVGSIIDHEFPKLEEVSTKAYEHCENIFNEIRNRMPKSEVNYSYGFPYVGSDESYFEDALTAANHSDLSIVVVGGKYGWGTSCTTGEGIDSASINLPPCQEKFLEKMGEIGAKFIVVHVDGRPISSNAAEKYASSIIEAWNGGEYCSQAIVETILGTNNPSGKLPVTVPFSSSQSPLVYNHHRGSSYHVNTISAFEQYIDMPHTPRYYFGFGLSYSEFDYKNLDVRVLNNQINVKFNVKNVSNIHGEEIVQVYIKDEYSTVTRPERELVGFGRVSLEGNQTKTVEMTIDLTQLAFLDKNMNWKIEGGEYSILVGKSCENIQLEESIKLEEDIYITNLDREFFAQCKVR